MPDTDLDHAAEQEIAGEHEELLRFLQQFRKLLDDQEVDRLELLVHVEAIAHVIESHFRHEEGDGGFFAEIVTEAPRLQHKVDALREQHAGFRAALDQLRTLAKAHRPLPSCWRAIARCFEEFTSQFLVHESLENDLVQEVYGRDLGDAE